MAKAAGFLETVYTVILAFIIVFYSTVFAGGISLGYEYLFVILSSLMFVIYLAAKALRGEKAFFDGITFLLFAYMGYLALNTFLSVSAFRSREACFFLFGCLLVFVSLRDLASGSVLVREYTLAAAAAGLTLSAVMNSAYIINLALKEGGLSFAGRFSSTLGNPNILAFFILFVLPLLYYFFRKTSSPALKALLVFSAFNCLFSLFFTFSRNGIFGAVILAVVFIFSGKSRRLIYAVLLSVFLLFGLFFALRSGPLAARILSVAPLESRLHLMEASLGILRNSPLSGTGFQSFSFIVNSVKEGGSWASHSHNLFLQILSEQGTVGLVLFLSFNLLLVLRLEPGRALNRVLLSCFLIFFSMQLFDYFLWIPVMQILYFVFISLFAGPAQPFKAKDRKNRLFPKALLAAVIIFIAWKRGAVPLFALSHYERSEEIKNENPRAALAQLEAAAAGYPHPFYLFSAGKLLFRQGEAGRDRALKYFQRAYRWNYYDPYFIDNYALAIEKPGERTYLDQKKLKSLMMWGMKADPYAEFVDFYTKYIELCDEPSEIIDIARKAALKTASVFKNISLMDAEKKEVVKTALLSPGDISEERRGHCLQNLGYPELALRVYEKLPSPQGLDLLVHHVTALIQIKDFDRAFMLAADTGGASENPELCELAARALYGQGRLEESLVYYHDLAPALSQYMPAQILRARILYDLGDYASAAGILESALYGLKGRREQLAGGLALLKRAYEKTGDREGAKSAGSRLSRVSGAPDYLFRSWVKINYKLAVKR